MTIHMTIGHRRMGMGMGMGMAHGGHHITLLITKGIFQ